MLEQQLQKYFEHTEFRPGQKEVIESILNKHDVVALMPTGGGKSLCYQLPAVINKNTTVIISPLIALMKDQVDSLNAQNIKASFINSTLSFSETEHIIKSVKSGETKILYIAPERFQNQKFKMIFSDLEIDLIAIDEAHCVSQWGHDFRPDYVLIKQYIKLLKNRPSVAAFTATATPEVRDDIIKNLGLVDPDVHVRGFDRPNLKFFAKSGFTEKQRELEALRIIKATPGSGIVYALTRKDTERLAVFLNENDIKSVAYHAGLDSKKRSKVQEDFMENRFDVIVATVAFGMGINKADIRFVIHLGMPSSLENYYQEAGRAGRDGETAYCLLLAAKKDNGLQNFLILKSKDEMLAMGKPYHEVQDLIDIKYRKYDRIKAYAESDQCRRKIILQYFADPDLNKYNGSCHGCDVCLNYQWKLAKTVKVKQAKDNKEQKVEVVPESLLSSTVNTSVEMYKKGYDIEKIAKIRDLGKSTILGHLIKWYLVDGELDINQFITKTQEKQILKAMIKAENYQYLKSIREQLPDEIGYEMIKLVVAKIQKIKI